MRNYNLLTRVSGEGLRASLPGTYAELLTPELLCQEKVSAIVFGTRVGTLNNARRAWADLGESIDGPVAAFGTDITLEAREFLERKSVRIYTLRHFDWTDAQYSTLRERSEARPKRRR
jgi:hypothetical protein